MDFKGQFSLAAGHMCYPLTVLDDHSRFLLGLRACANQLGRTVQSQLAAIFRCYGLPRAMLMDNGTPWATVETGHRLTVLTAWLIRLDIDVLHGRPNHPQTQGKDERLHRTLKVEVISRHPLTDWVSCQHYFDQWRQLYNCERPHEALGLTVPADRYRASPRPFPEHLPPILYDPGDIVRKVQDAGRISFAGRTFIIGKAFIGDPVALRPAAQDGC
jgi:transposase InsO family protein